MRRKRRRSTRVVARELKRHKIADIRHKIADISHNTVQRAAHDRGLRPFRRPITSRLTTSHKKGRLSFAKASKKKDWSTIVFSDEHRFKQFKGGNPRHDQVWAKSVSEVPGKEVERWGLTLDVWAGISSRGKTALAFYEGTLNAEDYQTILEDKLLPVAQEWFSDEKIAWEFQQDKATAHTAKSTKRWLEEHGVAEVAGWPTKGDDINPMENLWAIVDERLENKKFMTKPAMKRAILKIWDGLDAELLNNLIDSVPDRIRRIVKSKGGSIKSVH
jgi:hypothetical protein